jgi:hypothetical protein
MITAAYGKKDKRNAGQQWLKSISVALRCLLGGAQVLMIMAGNAKKDLKMQVSSG